MSRRDTQRLVLASRSPRRALLLRAAGYSFTVKAPSIEEDALPGEGPAAAAVRLAREKAADVAARRRRGMTLGADTVVVLDGEIFGKPSSRAEARRMLRRLSGREHRVITGVALCAAGGRVVRAGRCITRVRFRRLTRAEIDWYVGTGDPMDKAGAYGIQEGAALFITRISGSYTNVVGLPMELVYRMLGLPA